MSKTRVRSRISCAPIRASRGSTMSAFPTAPIMRSLASTWAGGRPRCSPSASSGGLEAAKAFYDALKLVKRLVNIGDTRTLCCHPASTTHRQMTSEEQLRAGVSAETIRLSVGIEHAQDIIEDLDQALSESIPRQLAGAKSATEIRPESSLHRRFSILSETVLVRNPDCPSSPRAARIKVGLRTLRLTSGQPHRREPGRALLRSRRTRPDDPERILPRAVTEWADKYGDAMALVSDRERLSFRALEARMNQYSRWALSAGVMRGETVALMMGNRPEYFAIWLGLIQIGAIAALISPESSRILASPRFESGRRATLHRRGRECADVCAEAIAGLDSPRNLGPWRRSRISPTHRRWRFLRSDGDPLAQASVRWSRSLIARSDFHLRNDRFPKAAEVSHRRLVVWTHWFAGLAGMTAEDRLYDCLPMHHSVGGVVAIGAPLVFGGSVAIAERFSAHGFWARYRALELHGLPIYRRALPLSRRSLASSRKKDP